MLLGLWLLACAPPTAAPWRDPAADDDWSAAVDAPEHRAEWDADEVAGAFAAALAFGFPAPQDALADYQELMTHTDPACPNAAFSEGFLELDGCTSAEGYTYLGSAGLIRTDTRVTAADGTWTGTYGLLFAPADYVIQRPDGTGLVAGGNAMVQIVHESGRASWRLRLTGTFVDEAAGGWLGAGYSGELSVTGDDDGGLHQTLDGALSVAGAAITFDGVGVAPDLCPDGLTGGVIGVRQPDATWYTITLDDGCGRCGNAVWNDAEDVGEACLDVSALVDAVADAGVP